MIVIELFAIAMASISAGFGSWAVARHRAGKRRERRIASPYEAARERWILTGDKDAYDEMLRLWKGE